MCAIGDAAVAAQPSLRDYKYFRALSIDLQGRIPTRQELRQLESDNFSFDTWIDAKLTSASYAERMRRIYMDRLRLEVNKTFTYEPAPVVLLRQEIIGPDGPEYVFYRKDQRRLDPAIDGTFCLTAAETGLVMSAAGVPSGTPRAVSRAALSRTTVVVEPWWLDALGGDAVAESLRLEPDASTPSTAVRVCREEAQTAKIGTVLATGRVQRPPAGTPPISGRAQHPPIDSPFAREHAGAPIHCVSREGLREAADCGCGPALERCIPLTGHARGTPTFRGPLEAPYRLEHPYATGELRIATWHHLWWSQEAVHFIDRIFTEDRDFREILTSRSTVINGPLAQFYRSTAPSSCCGIGVYLGYTEPQTLFDVDAVPASSPLAVDAWTVVEDRGDRAAGLLTMPVFLIKHATHRARAKAVYESFLCQQFTAGTGALPPSDEPNLMKRPGCAACHITLEPMAAYFARVGELDWNWLPAEHFPAMNPACARQSNGSVPRNCVENYDPVFSTDERGDLFGAYASAANVDAGPAGLAAQSVARPEFARCFASTVAESFLGRPMGDEDAPLIGRLTATFVDAGYQPAAMVRHLVHEDVYRRANNLPSEVWRSGAVGGEGGGR